MIELNVDQPYRGRGIGKRLLTELLDGRPEQYATLLADPAAPAHAMYQRWGWRIVDTVQSASDADPADALLFDLQADVAK